MIIPKSPPPICGGARLSTCASQPPRRSNTIGNRPSANTGWLNAPHSRLGWPREQITILDQDLGISGSGLAERAGFTHMTAEVALGHVGIVLGLEVSRLARNNADWYRLLDLCGTTETLIGDADGIYHPGMFNDRLVLGLKGTMSEAELHVLRARLNGGIRNKAARGELRRGLPVGLIWGEADGEVLLHPDEAVSGAVRAMFERFAEMGSARQVWLWFRQQGLRFPLQSSTLPDIRWVAPSYAKIHQVLSNPVYAGAYVYGKTRQERYIDDSGRIRKRLRHLPRSEWSVVIRDHHPGFIDWATFEANQLRLAQNTHPRPHQAGGAVREGAALLQGSQSVDAAGAACAFIIEVAIRPPDIIVRAAGLPTAEASGACASAAARSTLQWPRLSLPRWRRPVLRLHSRLPSKSNPIMTALSPSSGAKWNAPSMKRSGPSAAIVQSILKTGSWLAAWRPSGKTVCGSWKLPRAELSRREQQRPRQLRPQERCAIRSLGSDLKGVWSAPTTSDRDRKELLRALLEEVIIALQRHESRTHLTMRWRGGAITQLDVAVPRFQPMGPRTDEDTISLLRRLAALYPDEVIAGILNRQGRKTASGERFTANQVGSLRRYRKIPRFQPPAEPPQGESATIRKAAQILGLNTSTIHRWLADGFIAGEQSLPAPRGRFASRMSCARGSWSRPHPIICRCWKLPLNSVFRGRRCCSV